MYLDARELPVLDMFQEIWTNISKKVFERREAAHLATGPFSTYINAIFDSDSKSARIYKAIPSTRHLGRVHSIQHSQNKVIVKLEASTGSCTCGDFQNNMRPCPHALALITELRLSPNTFMAPFHTLRAWQGTYLLSVPPVLAANLPMDGSVLPPSHKKKRGRPQKRRMEQAHAKATLSEVIEEPLDPGIPVVDHTVNNGQDQVIAFQPASVQEVGRRA